MASSLEDNIIYLNAKTATEKGNYKEAIQLYQSLQQQHTSKNNDNTILPQSPNIDQMIKSEMIQPLLTKCYGVKGSDTTISLWYDAPLASHASPPCYQCCAYVQVGNKLYRQ